VSNADYRGIYSLNSRRKSSGRGIGINVPKLNALDHGTRRWFTGVSFETRPHRHWRLPRWTTGINGVQIVEASSTQTWNTGRQGYSNNFFVQFRGTALEWCELRPTRETATKKIHRQGHLDRQTSGFVRGYQQNDGYRLRQYFGKGPGGGKLQNGPPLGFNIFREQRNYNGGRTARKAGITRWPGLAQVTRGASRIQRAPFALEVRHWIVFGKLRRGHFKDGGSSRRNQIWRPSDALA